MAAETAPLPIHTSRSVLAAFVDETEHTAAATFEDLQELVNPDVAEAIIALIIHNGHMPKNPSTSCFAVLDETRGLTRIRGTVGLSAHDESKRYIEISQAARRPIRFKRQQLLMLTNEGLGNFSTAFDGDNVYHPYRASQEYQDYYAGVVGGTVIYGETGQTTGFGIANEAALRAPEDLAGFIHVSRQLVSGLLQIDPLARK